MFEADFMALLMPINGNRVWWTRLPDGMAIAKGQPVIILSRPGGKVHQYVEKDLVPSHKHTRVQVTIWSDDDLLMRPLARLVEDTLVKSAYPVEVYGAPTDAYDQDGNIVGSEQQFGVWYPDP